MIEITIPKSRLMDCIEDICENYCRWETESYDQAQLDRICAECPLNNIDYDEYWERREEE